MTKLALIPAAVVLAVVVVEGQQRPPTDPNDAEQMLVARERALHEAVVTADKSAFLSLVLPEGVWAAKSGFIPMNLLVNGLDAFHVTSWDIVNPHVTWLDENSAIVLYTWRGTGTFGDQPLASTILASTVWTRRNGKWLAGHHQQTDLATQ